MNERITMMRERAMINRKQRLLYMQVDDLDGSLRKDLGFYLWRKGAPRCSVQF